MTNINFCFSVHHTLSSHGLMSQRNS